MQTEKFVPALVAEELKKQSKGLFEDKTYDAIATAVLSYWGENETWIEPDNRQIVVNTGCVAFRMSFSSNETKIYIRSFVTGNAETFEEREAEYFMCKINPHFRLFGLEEVLEYLQIKKREDDWIRHNEG